ncbi:MAG: HAD family hydrolase [Gammaproteobacteria bacterium]
MNSPNDNNNSNIRAYKSIDPIRQQLSDADGSRIYVDFDYTLFQSNSTEAFLNSGRPAFLNALFLRVLSVITPWAMIDRARGAFLWRDAVRVWTVLLLFPWTLWLFNRKAPGLFAQFQNAEIVALLRKVDPDRIVIVTNGYRRFVQMLLRGSELENAHLVGSSLLQPVRVRALGKLAILREDGFDPVYERDIVVTDSMDDEDLLRALDHAYLIAPEGMNNHNELAGVYVPFFYSARVKRSPEFVVKQMFLEELVIILLATVFFLPFSLSLWFAAILLFVGFLAAYEIGYAENDRIGYLKEARPKLSDDYEQFKDVALEPAAWFWVVGLTIAGVWMLGADMQASILQRLGFATSTSPLIQLVTLAAVWVAIVVAGRGLFFWYNRMPMIWRVFGYILLHFGKYFSLVILFSSQPVGYALLCAQIVRTWSLYAIRRSGGNMELVASQSIRLAFFALFLVAFDLATPEFSAFSQWHTWVIIGFCVIRAAPEARRKLFDRDVLRNGMRGRNDR